MEPSRLEHESSQTTYLIRSNDRYAWAYQNSTIPDAQAPVFESG